MFAAGQSYAQASQFSLTFDPTGVSSAAPLGDARRRALSQGPAFSLGWGGGDDNSAEHASMGGKRQFGSSAAPSKEAYAAMLREQIASKSNKGNGYGSGGMGSTGMRRSSSIATAAMLGLGSSPEAAPGHYDGGGGRAYDGNGGRAADVAPGARALSYAEELKAQIDSRANTKSNARAARLAADREDDVRVERESHQYQDQKQRERDSQQERSRVVQARADSLERFLGERGDSVQFGAVGREGGRAAAAPARASQMRPPQMPTPTRGGDVGYGRAAPSDWVGCGALPGQNAGGDQGYGRVPSSDRMGGGGVLPGQQAVGGGHVSSNRYATGANQNCGNVLTDKPSSRVLAPPGGKSSFSLG
mmetsp:Transcript_66765/g.215843  ORF Transcript_66765/g.215843 Transcript_66765/m.215843 type:complete len:361 (-) Transcript_66765:717-1799(-)